MKPQLETKWRRFCHFMEHVTLRNPGYVVTRWKGDRLVSGFKCHTCGRIQAEHVICVRPDPEAMFSKRSGA